MPRVSDFQVVERAEQPVLSVRKTIKIEEMPGVIGETYGKIGAYLKDSGAYLADAPFLVYHNMDMQALDIELCFPFAKPRGGFAEFVPGFIAGGKFACCTYRGPYTEIGETYDEMMKWIDENGHKPTGIYHECYLNGPEVPENEYLTNIIARLA